MNKQPLLLLNSSVKILHRVLPFKSCIFKVHQKNPKQHSSFFNGVGKTLFLLLFLIWKNKCITGNNSMSIIMQNASEWMHLKSIFMTIKGGGKKKLCCHQFVFYLQKPFQTHVSGQMFRCCKSQLSINLRHSNTALFL